MAIDFKTLLTVLPHVTDANHPVLLRGRHGIGKSSVVYQFAETVGLKVVERRASQMTEGDLLGLPKMDGDVTSFCPPDWFSEACSTGVLLFLDEVDRATLEVRQGIFELCDSRKLAGHVLHPETLIFAAVNGGTHAGAASYQVGEMDPAELDRYTTFDVEPTVDDWLTWAQSRLDPMVVDFIRNNVAHLEHNDDYEPNKVYPSRRSWDRLNGCLTNAGLLSEATPALFNLSAAFVGFEAAVSFQDFVQNYERQVTVSDILDAGAVEKTNDFNINEHCALIEKMVSTEVFHGELTDDQCKNLANYFVSLPSEAVMKLWQALGSGNVDNVTRFHKAEADNGETVGGKLVTILTGK